MFKFDITSQFNSLFKGVEELIHLAGPIQVISDKDAMIAISVEERNHALENIFAIPTGLDSQAIKNERYLPALAIGYECTFERIVADFLKRQCLFNGVS
ncbi:hypothetical protein Acid7E03_31440 [Acidisoma sp. 7E03]